MDPFPEQLGVFPLPSVVLFPHAHVPLHVFEPRYRALVGSALQNDGRLILATLKPGYQADYYGCPEVHPLACAGKIVEHELFEDGRSDIIVQGERVVEITDIVAKCPFRVARFRAAAPEAAIATGCEDRVEELRTLIERACPGAYAPLEERLFRKPEEDGGLELLNTLASGFPVSIEMKLRWLACPESCSRWNEVRRTLLALVANRSRRQKLVQRYGDLRPGDPRQN
jgi:hypothetical protein